MWLGSLVAGRDVVLRDEAGAVVPATISTVTADGMRFALVATPDAFLPAGARIEATSGGDVVTSFLVGDAIDDEPPSVPMVDAVTTRSSLPNVISPCGGFGVSEHVASFAVRHDGFVLVAVRDGGDRIDVAAISGDVDAATLERTVTVTGGMCDSGWANAAPLATAAWRFGAFDVAGNFSGFSDEHDVTLPLPGCSCDARGGDAPAARCAAVVVALAGVAARRRRRSTSTDASRPFDARPATAPTDRSRPARS